MLKPSWRNGRLPSKSHHRPRRSRSRQRASRALTTNQPSTSATRPYLVSLSGASGMRPKGYAGALRDRDERLDDLRVELRPGVSAQLGNRLVLRQRLAVRPVGRHRVVGVAGGDDPRQRRDLLAAEPVGVARAVVALVAGADDLADLAEQAADAVQEPLALDRVALDDLELLGRERAGLVDDLVRDSELADVVQQRRELRVAPLALAPAPARRPPRESGRRRRGCARPYSRRPPRRRPRAGTPSRGTRRGARARGRSAPCAPARTPRADRRAGSPAPHRRANPSPRTPRRGRSSPGRCRSCRPSPWHEAAPSAVRPGPTTRGAPRFRSRARTASRARARRAASRGGSAQALRPRRGRVQGRPRASSSRAA